MDVFDLAFSPKARINKQPNGEGISLPFILLTPTFLQRKMKMEIYIFYLDGLYPSRVILKANSNAAYAAKEACTGLYHRAPT